MHSRAVRDQALTLIQAGFNDCDVARRTGIARTTIRDWRKPRYEPSVPAGRRAICPRCGKSARELAFTEEDYSELLGIYLGDGYIVQMGRTSRLRIYLDMRHPVIIESVAALLRRCFPANKVGVAGSSQYRMSVLSVYSSHLPCLLPQHGPGKKHERVIALETWQRRMVEAHPWRFLRGCIWTDGCSFINRTDPYEYLSYDFFNCSGDILDLFCDMCERAGVEYRRYAKRIRINRRASVALMEANVGIKR
jgi:hypothetical protein